MLNLLPSVGASAVLLAAWLPMTSPAQTSPGPNTAACPALLQHQFTRLQDDAPQNLCQYAGKVVLVVNTASYCGYTRQYEGLEALYAKYEKRGLVILGFPANNFGQQEPGSAKQIAELCFNTYGVKFPMFNKTDVVGPQRNALYTQLFQATKAAPQWNFHKYLISRDGQRVQSYASSVEPMGPQLTAAIEAALQR
ncbi:MAG: glutathione peroxidase [Curvibacter sp.]|jgi:glutathione peroxidase|nr:glutathione peroxidase [Curvibacter sp.]